MRKNFKSRRANRYRTRTIKKRGKGFLNTMLNASALASRMSGRGRRRLVRGRRGKGLIGGILGKIPILGALTNFLL